MRLILASGNAAKRARLAALLEGLEVELLAPEQVGPDPAGLEEGDVSLAANAMAKAAAWARRYGMAAVSSDGGLDVPGLGERWKPALTRRAAGEAADDHQRARHLLDLMQGLEDEGRGACQVEAIALADARGEMQGVWEVRGRRVRILEAANWRGVPRGFWIPAVLDYGGERRYGDLSLDERTALEDHWEQLRGPLRAAVERLSG